MKRSSSINNNNNNKLQLDTSSLTAFSAPANLTTVLTTDAGDTDDDNKNSSDVKVINSTDSSVVSSVTMSPQEVVLNKGKSFDVTLNLEEEISLWGILASVKYDDDILELSNYSLGNIFTDNLFTVQKDIAKNPYKFLATLDNVGEISAKGNFITLHFNIKDNADDTDTVISLENVEVVGKDTQLEAGEGNNAFVAVDNTAPVIEGIKDGVTYYGDTVVTIVEDHIASVTVNGKTVTLTDGKFTLTPSDESQTIVVTDKAGNTTTVTVNVKEPETLLGGKSPLTGYFEELAPWFAVIFVIGGVTLMLILRRKKQNSR